MIKVCDLCLQPYKTKHRDSRFCSRKCWRADKFIWRRFWRQVDRGDPAECWEWKGSRDPRNYGQIKDGAGKGHSSHRMAWSLCCGAIPRGMWVLHTCNNPPCVNPNHLYIGTHEDNVADRGRAGNHTAGERNWNSKLTGEQVLAIREEYASLVEEAGNAPCKKGSVERLAERHGVTRNTIYKIVLRQAWKHL